MRACKRLKLILILSVPQFFNARANSIKKNMKFLKEMFGEGFERFTHVIISWVNPNSHLEAKDLQIVSQYSKLNYQELILLDITSPRNEELFQSLREKEFLEETSSIKLNLSSKSLIYIHE